MRISDWSSDVCSSDLRAGGEKLARALRFFADRPDPVIDRIARRLDAGLALRPRRGDQRANMLRLFRQHVGHVRLEAVLAQSQHEEIGEAVGVEAVKGPHAVREMVGHPLAVARSEEQTSELQSLMRTSYA